MRRIHRSIAIGTALLVGAASVACSEAEERASGPAGSSTQKAMEAAEPSWDSFLRAARADLEAAEERLERVGEGLEELERHRVDLWLGRARRARAEITREIAAAPAKRAEDRAEFKLELEEIRREADSLLEIEHQGARAAGSKASE